MSVALVAALFSCEKENQEPKFIGTMEKSHSKIALNTIENDPNFGTLNWELDDQVWITGYILTGNGSGANGGLFGVRDINNGRAYLEKVDGNNNLFSNWTDFISIYPRSQVVENYNGHGSWVRLDANHSYFRMLMPYEQHPNAAGYDPRTLIITSQAQKQGSTVQFTYKNVVAYLSFSIDNAASNVAYVQVTCDRSGASNANGNADHGQLVGITYVHTDTGETDFNSGFAFDAIQSNGDDPHKVVFRNSDSSPLTTGKTYYIGIWPGNFTWGTSDYHARNKTNVTVQAYDANDNPIGAAKVASGARNFVRNNIYNVGTLGTGSKQMEW